MLLIPKRNAGFLFKAIKFATSDILNLLQVDKEGLFSPKQGRGQETLLSSISEDARLKHNEIDVS